MPFSKISRPINMRSIPILFFLLCLALYVNAQVPGYLGKRFSLGYDMQASPPGMSNFNTMEGNLVFTADGINFKGEPNSLWKPQLKHSILAEYVVSKRLALHTGYQFYRFAVPSNYENDVAVQDSFYRVRNGGIRFGFSVSRKNYFAPQGKYFSMDFQMINEQLINYVSQTETEVGKGTLWGINMDWGVKRILYDKLILDYAFGIGMTYTTSRTFQYSRFEEDLSDIGYVHFAFNFIHFKGGVRYLLF